MLQNKAGSVVKLKRQSSSPVIHVVLVHHYIFHLISSLLVTEISSAQFFWKLINFIEWSSYEICSDQKARSHFLKLTSIRMFQKISWCLKISSKLKILKKIFPFFFLDFKFHGSVERDEYRNQVKVIVQKILSKKLFRFSSGKKFDICSTLG